MPCSATLVWQYCLLTGNCLHCYMSSSFYITWHSLTRLLAAVQTLQRKQRSMRHGRTGPRCCVRRSSTRRLMVCVAALQLQLQLSQLAHHTCAAAGGVSAGVPAWRTCAAWYLLCKLTCRTGVAHHHKQVPGTCCCRELEHHQQQHHTNCGTAKNVSTPPPPPQLSYSVVHPPHQPFVRRPHLAPCMAAGV